jgi:CBS domain-containing protein
MNRPAATMPIFQIMTTAPVTVQPQTTVVELLALFDRHDYNAFPVVAPGGTLRGIVLDLNLQALALLGDTKELVVVPRATLPVPVEARQLKEQTVGC